MEGLEFVARQLGEERASVKGIPQMCYLDFVDEALSAEFAVAAARRGVIFKRSAYNFVSLAHTESIVFKAIATLEQTAAEVMESC